MGWWSKVKHFIKKTGKKVKKYAKKGYHYTKKKIVPKAKKVGGWFYKKSKPYLKYAKKEIASAYKEGKEFVKTGLHTGEKIMKSTGTAVEGIAGISKSLSNPILLAGVATLAILILKK